MRGRRPDYKPHQCVLTSGTPTNDGLPVAFPSKAQIGVKRHAHREPSNVHTSSKETQRDLFWVSIKISGISPSGRHFLVLGVALRLPFPPIWKKSKGKPSLDTAFRAVFLEKPFWGVKEIV